MNRKSFMAELRSLLAFLDAAERDRVLSRYERMFDEAGPEGEAAVIRCFGSPVRQVLQIEREYREAVASGETPFADGEAIGPEEAEAPEETEIIEEEYTGVHLLAEETEPEAEEPLPEELPEELIEEPPEEPLPEPDPEEEIAAEPEPAVLPEIDLDELDFSDLGLTFTKRPAAPEKEPEEGSIKTPDEPAEDEEPLPLGPQHSEDVLPDDGLRRTLPADGDFAALITEEPAESLPGKETDGPAAPDEEKPQTEPENSAPAEETAPEAPIKPETELPEPEEPETPDGTKSGDGFLPEEESFSEETAGSEEAEEPAEEPAAEEEYEYEEIEERHPVPGGRAFAAVVVTIPMLAVWALLFGLSLALGVAVLGVGAALAVAGVYLAGYVFNGAIVRMPDLLLTAGTALAVFALALLLVWAAAWMSCSATCSARRSWGMEGNTMLGKLMKYDLRSGIRTFSLIWIGLAVLAAINGLTLRIAFDGDIQSELANFIITVLPMVLLVALYAAMGIFVLVFIINRFYKGLLGDEGYLMFTLPVSTSEHIGSKLLTSLIFQIGSIAVAVLSGGLLLSVLAPANLSDITAAIRDVTDYLTGNPLPAGTGWVIAEFAVYMLIGAAVTILQIYTAISIGHLAKKHRGWFALLAYIGISIAVSVVMRGCMSLFFQSSGAAADILLGWQISVDNSGWHTQGIGMMASALGIYIGLALLEGTGFFFATRAILNKRLNLE